MNLTYKDAGVDIDSGEKLVSNIKALAKATARPEVVGGLGGFGALFDLSQTKYRHPILVSGTDGVGTKLKLAIETGRHDTIGIDLVAMCVNDILAHGAEPLFFLDYYATSRLQLEVAETVIKGIGLGCLQAGCSLVGGETAEMPGLYQTGDYDLAGFCVGIVEKELMITPNKVHTGDQLIALASSGPHANGYSLIRKILTINNIDINQMFENESLADVLLAPTKIYVRSILELLTSVDIHGIAHITGGGLTENIPRIFNTGLQANIRQDSWEWPAIFRWLQEQAQIAEPEMLRTFNCGVGLVIAIAASDVERCLISLTQQGETAWLIGNITSGDHTVHYV